MTTLYAQRDPEALGELYLRHVNAMTGERLHEKSAIAAELAYRDAVIAAERTARDSAERERDAALEALARLIDAQNGPPLLGGSAERFWCEAMEMARAVLGREPR